MTQTWKQLPHCSMSRSTEASDRPGGQCGPRGYPPARHPLVPVRASGQKLGDAGIYLPALPRSPYLVSPSRDASWGPVVARA